MPTLTRSVRSAGGVLVRRETDGSLHVLLGRRGPLWRLPKGKLEAGESDAQAAEREVAEETGEGGRVVARLGEVDFSFMEGRTRIEKTAVHFLLLATGRAGEPDGEFDRVEWMPIAKARRLLRYPAERAAIRSALSLIDADPALVPVMRPTWRARLRILVARLQGGR
jgi:8-oxo-dGTP pyrophosphatase MutT (NUDIX family)